MKYSDMIAKEIHKAGWSYGSCQYVDVSGKWMYSVDANKDGRKCVASAENLCAAYIGLKNTIEAIDSQGMS